MEKSAPSYVLAAEADVMSFGQQGRISQILGEAPVQRELRALGHAATRLDDGRGAGVQFESRRNLQ